jgi:hypothetical protein
MTNVRIRCSLTAVRSRMYALACLRAFILSFLTRCRSWRLFARSFAWGAHSLTAAPLMSLPASLAVRLVFGKSVAGVVVPITTLKKIFSEAALRVARCLCLPHCWDVSVQCLYKFGAFLQSISVHIPCGAAPVASGVATLSSCGNPFGCPKRSIGECRFRSSASVLIGRGLPSRYFLPCPSVRSR